MAHLHPSNGTHSLLEVANVETQEVSGADQAAITRAVTVHCHWGQCQAVTLIIICVVVAFVCASICLIWKRMNEMHGLILSLQRTEQNHSQPNRNKTIVGNGNLRESPAEPEYIPLRTLKRRSRISV